MLSEVNFCFLRYDILVKYAKSSLLCCNSAAIRDSPFVIYLCTIKIFNISIPQFFLPSKKNSPASVMVSK